MIEALASNGKLLDKKQMPSTSAGRYPAAGRRTPSRSAAASRAVTSHRRVAFSIPRCPSRGFCSRALIWPEPDAEHRLGIGV